MQSDACTQPIMHSHIKKTYVSTFNRYYSLQIYIQGAAQEFSSHTSVSISFEFKFLWHVDWLGVFRGYSYWCIRHASVWETRVYVCVCVCASVKTKRQFSEYLIPAHCLFPVVHHNADHWDMQGCTQRQTNTNKHKHTPVQSASAVDDSEGLVCKGFVPERRPCKRTCRQDPKPCCTPASPPQSLGTNPAHKHTQC